MGGLAGTGTHRERVGKIPLPCRRVLAAAEAARLGPIQNSLDSAPHPPGGLVLFLPDRVQYAQHLLALDLGYGHVTQYRHRVRFERGRPLRRVLLVPPRIATPFDVGGSAFAERLALALRSL